MKNLLTQNAKMRKSSQNGITVVNWTIPAFQSKTGLKTCPNAGRCAAGCYARQGAYIWQNVASAHEAKLELTQNDTFIDLMIAEINQWVNKKSVKRLKVRIHDAGDFYSLEYLNRWIKIMSYFEKYDNRVTFYAYTKQVEMFQSEKARLPSNFRAIFSFGGKQDKLIQIETDFHARVFESLEALVAAGYTDGTQDDMVAAMGKSNRIGLCYHGAKNFANTKWGSVA
jgi:hypothetical protein